MAPVPKPPSEIPPTPTGIGIVQGRGSPSYTPRPLLPWRRVLSWLSPRRRKR